MHNVSIGSYKAKSKSKIGKSENIDRKPNNSIRKKKKKKKSKIKVKFTVSGILNSFLFWLVALFPFFAYYWLAFLFVSFLLRKIYSLKVFTF